MSARAPARYSCGSCLPSSPRSASSARSSGHAAAPPPWSHSARQQNGTLHTSRCPRAERPPLRVMLVEIAVSSMNTSRLGSSLRWLRRQRRRMAATSGRSCSAACRAFFIRQPEMAQKAEHRRGRNHHPSLGKPGLQFQQRQVRLLGNPSLDPLGILRQRIILVATKLVRTDAAGGAVSPDVAANRTQADPAQLRQRPAACDPPRSAVPQPASGHPRRACPSLLASQPAGSLNQTAPRRGKNQFSLFGGCSKCFHPPIGKIALTSSSSRKLSCSGRWIRCSASQPRWRARIRISSGVVGRRRGCLGG